MPERKSRSRRASDTTKFARALRQGNNFAEGTLWNELKARKLGNHKFVRQFPIGSYFADFLCRSKKLVVEVDGSQHSENESDLVRDAHFTKSAYIVARFWAADVLNNPPAACETILAILDRRISTATATPELQVKFPD